ncbi:MAG: cytochrome P450 [Actinomycetota bacterium]|nr:cytochrome P450 [Actinomycetota bacterium]
MTALDAQATPVGDLDPFGDDFLEDPYQAHRDLREAGCAVWLERYRVWAMARHEQVDAALRDPETYCSRRGVGLTDFAWRPPSLLLEADPPDHTRARRAITAVLSPRTVKAMRENFASEAGTMVDRLVTRGRFDGVADLAAAFPLKVMPDQVGLPPDGRENLLPYGNLAFNAFGPRNARLELAMSTAAPASAWIAECTRRENLAPAGIGARIHEAAQAEDFAEPEGELLVRSVLTAGLDTTVHALGNALLCFAAHPDQWTQLRQEPALARAAFEEVIRFESPVQTFFRTTTRGARVEDLKLPEGEKMLLFLAAANRDPRRWEDPDRFDIRRPASGHVGFGSGIHACVGQMIARLEGQVVLAALAKRVARIEFDGQPRRQLNNTLRGLDSLPLKVTGA